MFLARTGGSWGWDMKNKANFAFENCLCAKIGQCRGEEVAKRTNTVAARHKSDCWAADEMAYPDDVVFLNQENIQSFLPDAFSWLAQEISDVLPCAAVIQNGQAVTICRSVRISNEAAEAGLETLSVYRGRGYAGLAVMAWARAVRKEGRMPLYSTSWDNIASQQVAKKLGLRWYGVNFSVG